MLSLTRPAAAQTCLPYSQFMALTRASDMEVKLTYVGIQEEPIETVLFTSDSNQSSRSDFLPPAW